MSIPCSFCGADVAAGASFCSKCGLRTSDNAEAPASAAADDPTNAPSGGVAAMRRAGERLVEGVNREDQLWQGAYSGKSMIGSWIGAGLFTLLALIAGVFFAFTGLAVVLALAAVLVVWLWVVGTLLYRQWSVRYSLTTQRFVHETGLLSRRTDRIEVIDIDDVTVKQGFIERFLNVGTIELVAKDQSHPVLLLRGIDDVKRVAGLIDDARRAERRKRGIHLE